MEGEGEGEVVVLFFSKLKDILSALKPSFLKYQNRIFFPQSLHAFYFNILLLKEEEAVTTF